MERCIALYQGVLQEEIAPDNRPGASPKHRDRGVAKEPRAYTDLPRTGEGPVHSQTYDALGVVRVDPRPVGCGYLAHGDDL